MEIVRVGANRLNDMIVNFVYERRRKVAKASMTDVFRSSLRQKRAIQL